MLETNAVHFLPAAELQALPARPQDAAHAAKEFEAMLLETILRHSGLLRAFEGAEGGGQALMTEWLVPLLARQLAEQVQLGLGEMMMKSLSAHTGEAQP